MPKLIIGNLDFNDKKVTQTLLSSIKNLTNNQSSYYDLIVKNGACFEAPKLKSNIGAGWYIILNKKKPLYVGESTDLYKRLSTPNGSRDNFNNTQRTADSVRNFIKKFTDIGLISKLRVFVIQESDLDFNGLTDLDRKNIEKLISIYRSEMSF